MPERGATPRHSFKEEAQMANGFKKGVSGMAANVDTGPKTPAKVGGPKSGAKDMGSAGDERSTKKFTEKKADFAEGGDTPMFGHQNADPQKPGGTAHNNGAPQSQGTGAQFASGGSTKMFGYTGSLPAQAGITSAR
jgi:hypothetical protein